MIGPAAKSPPAPKRVLIIKPSALGDVVTALPVLRGLRRSFPDAHIAWMISTSYAELLRDDPDLDEIVYFDRRKLGRCWWDPSGHAALWALWWRLRRGKYDWVIDLQGLVRSGIFSRWSRAKVRAGFADAREGAGWFYNHKITTTGEHTVARNIELARRLGIDAREEDMTLTVSDSGREFAKAFCSERGLKGKDFIVCVPPTRWVTKRYPIRHWRRVVGELSKEITVALLGSPAEAERLMCRQVSEGLGSSVANLAGRTSIPQMVGLIAASGGVICSDSAAKFIASAVGVETITLIGPTREERTGPYPRGRTIVADVPCRRCLKKRCQHVICMESIRPGLVLAAARDMMGCGDL